MNFETSIILEKIQGRFVCLHNGKAYEFEDKEDFKQSDFNDGYVISSIRVNESVLVLELNAWAPPITDISGEWTKEYKGQNGTDPSYF